MSEEAGKSRQPLHHGRFRFSMASVLLATALVAVVLAGLRTAASLSDPKVDWIAFAGISGLLVGAVVGGEIGMAQPDRIRHGMLGATLGMMGGAVGGVMAAMPQCLPVVLLGAPILVGFAALMRRLSK
ncbi:MAG: hypothetical protein GXY83_08435 [Rhodopirellula sp.]|nr:hypothetical protein [Rhodopirellula sp.]